MDRILGREGVDTRTLGHFYVMAVQAILLFGSETWVATLQIKRLWGGVPLQGGMADIRKHSLASDRGDVGISSIGG